MTSNVLPEVAFSNTLAISGGQKAGLGGLDESTVRLNGLLMWQERPMSRSCRRAGQNDVPGLKTAVDHFLLSMDLVELRIQQCYRA